MNRAGMTLIEVLVGLVIVALVLAAGYGALASVIDAKEHAAKSVNPATRAASARDVLAGWIAGARVTGKIGDPTFAGVDRGPAWDELTFLTTSAPPFSRSQTLVRLYLHVGGEPPDTGLVAELREWRGDRSARVLLVPGAIGFNARYAGWTDGALVWQADWVSAERLPAAAELTVRLASRDSVSGLVELPLRIRLEAAERCGAGVC